MIEGVRVRKLKLVADRRGWLMEILRPDWEEFVKFGQVYATAVYPGVVKAWHRHRRQRDFFACVQGAARVVLYDGEEGSPTRGEVDEFLIGPLNPLLVVIPPGVWHGFAAAGPQTAVVVNAPTEPYDYGEPDEERLPAHTDEIPFDWEKVDG